MAFRRQRGFRLGRLFRYSGRLQSGKAGIKVGGRETNIVDFDEAAKRRAGLARLVVESAGATQDARQVVNTVNGSLENT